MTGLTLDRELINKPKEKYWISYIKQRIKQNKNFIGFISGPTGSGKSWSSLSICEQLDKNFDIDRVVFSGVELMDLINSGKLERGSAICFEEVGVEMNSKNWASVTNKMINYLVQTFRHRGFILIMNSPYMDFVDSSTRKLFHAEMITMGINYNTKECKLKPQLIQYNGRLQKFYYKRLRVITREGVKPLTLWNVEKPQKELVKAYEEKKRAYTDSLNKRIYEELLEAQNKNKPDKKSGKELTDIQKETIEFLKKGYTIKQIAVARDRHKKVINKCVEGIKKKGYKINPVYDVDHRRIKHYEVIEPIREES